MNDFSFLFSEEIPNRENRENNRKLLFKLNYYYSESEIMSRGIGDQKLLQKRIPRSARYDNVRAKTDTGASMSKHLARLNEIQNNYRIQKGEESGHDS